MSSISAGTTSTTGYVVTSDTTGALVLKTGASATTAVTIDTSQNVTLAVGSANGVTYLNGSKVLTSGSALTFDGTNLASTGNITSGGVLQALTTVQSSSGADLSLNANGANRDVIYKVNATELMRLVGSTGNLGIGTSSPDASYKLTISGNSGSVTAGIAFVDQASSPKNYSLYINGSKNFVLRNSTDGANIWEATSSGNLGLGVTPSAWATFTGLQVGALGGVNIGGATGDNFYAMNAYYNAGWKYAATGYTALMYRMVNGEHRWSNAASGTAGNTISFTQAMTLDASGNFALGTTPVLGYLQTTQIGTSDSTLYRHHRHNSGGGTAHADACTQTTTAITTAKAIAGIEDASFLLVRGSDGSGNEFMDLVITQNSGTPTVITSKTLSGSPAARTYAISSFNLTLAMASGTYKTNCLWWQLSSR